MMKLCKEWYVWFSVRDNTLYINSETLTPNCDGMSFKERCEAFNEAFRHTIEERLEMYADDDVKEAIKKEIDSHKGCELSEFIIPDIGL